jgi:hypothetical protein
MNNIGNMNIGIIFTAPMWRTIKEHKNIHFVLVKSHENDVSRNKFVVDEKYACLIKYSNCNLTPLKQH